MSVVAILFKIQTPSSFEKQTESPLILEVRSGALRVIKVRPIMEDG